MSQSCSGHQRNVLKCVMNKQNCCFAPKTIKFLLYFQIDVVVVAITVVTYFLSLLLSNVGKLFWS